MSKEAQHAYERKQDDWTWEGYPIMHNDYERMNRTFVRSYEVMPWGKYNGKPFTKVPAYYKKWLLEKAQIDGYLRAAIQNSLR